MIKVLKQESETFKKLELLNSFLSEQGIEISQTVYNGIIFKHNNNYFKYTSEGEITENLPPFYDGRYILCDVNGNTDFYN
jgi:hypothetical protein